jgi:hypothetical protein
MEPESLAYVPASDEEWNVVAASTATVELHPNEDEPVAIIVSGPCPRCGHSTAFVEPVVLYSSLQRDGVNPEANRVLTEALQRASQAVRERNVEIICACGFGHAGAPQDRKGCGASWVLHVAWGLPA